MKRTANGRGPAWIPWAALLLGSALAPPPAAAQIPKPLTIQGWLKDSDPLDRLRKQSYQRVHEVELKLDQVYLIELRSLDFDTFLRVEDAKGTALADNDDLAPGNTNSRLGFVPSATAKYRLIVTSFPGQQTGEYILQLRPLQPTAETKTFEGKLTKDTPQVNKRHTQVHKVQVEAERWYLIDLISKEFNPYLLLRDGQGKVLAQDDDSGGDLNARLLWFAEKKSEWLVQVLAYTPGAKGAYTVRWRPYQGPVQSDLTERERWVQQAEGLERRLLELYRAGKPAEAVKPGQQVLLLYEKVYPKNNYPLGHHKLARSLNNLGGLLNAQGEYAKALPYLEQALTMLWQLYPKAKYPGGHLHLAQSLNNLGSLLQAQGEYAKALPYFEQALVMKQQLYSKAQFPLGHPDLAQSLNNLGSLLQAQGEYARARSFYEQTLTMRQQLFPKVQYPLGHPDLAQSLNDLGFLLYAQGEHAKALPFYEQALAMRQQFFPKGQYPQGHPDLAISLNNLGALLNTQGEYAKALPYFEQCLAMRQQLYPKDQYPRGHPHLVSSLNNLGFLLEAQKEHARALPYYEQALAMTQQLYPKGQYPRGHPELASSLNNLGCLLRAQEEYAKALLYLEQSLAMHQQLYPKDKYPQGHPELATSLNNLGGLLQAQGEYAKALPLYERSLAMTQQLYPKGQYPQGHPELATSLNNLGALLRAQGAYAKALPYLEQSLAIYRHLSQRFAAEAEALRFLYRTPRTLGNYLSIPLADARSAEATYAQIWHSKGLLTRLLQRRHQAARIALAGPGPVRQKWAQLLDARHQLARLLLQPAQDGATRDKELARLTNLKEGLERDLSKLLPEIERTKALTDLGPTDLASLLPKETAFIDLVRYAHFGKSNTWSFRYLAFVVLPDKTVQRIDLKEAEPIDKAVRAWLWNIARSRDSDADAARVGQLVWAPLAKVLPANTKVVFLAPNGELARLPWPALPGKKANTILLEDLAVAVVPHGPFLLEQLKYPPEYGKGPDAVLALGDVDYGPALQGGYAALKGTSTELKQVAGLVGKRALLTLSKDKATWDKLKEMLPKVRYAHLATHGFFDAPALDREYARLAKQQRDWRKDQTTQETGFGVRSPLSYTGLVLAGANDPKRAANGVLLGEPLVDLPLEGLELCVLSACETGLGDWLFEGEGVQGLPRAFHLAGCRTVVSSLWSVNDQATAALMARFYHELWTNGKTPLEALRLAQLTIYRHPERITDLADRERPNFHKTVALPPDVTPEGRKRTPTRLWAAFQVSGVGQ